MTDLYKRWHPPVEPYHPATGYDETLVYAMRALADGTANESQQQLCWKWLQFVAGVGDFQDMSFRPGGQDGDRLTAFAEGKRFVGLQLLKLLHPATLEAVLRERTEREKREAARGKR